MGMCKVTLFNLDRPDLMPIEATFDYDSNAEDERAFSGIKLAITAGDNTGAGTVTLPADVLAHLLETVTKENVRRCSAIMTPNLPKIILPN